MLVRVAAVLVAMFVGGWGLHARRLVSIPVPTADQLAWNEHEIMALTHFNMQTFIAPDTCSSSNWNSGPTTSNPGTFNPSTLNVTNWVQSYLALGAKHAVLTAKHNCGFCLWDTQVPLPNGTIYPYSVMKTGALQRNVVEEFAEACAAAGLGHGYYYSVGNNFFLNRMNFEVAGDLLPGQVNVTDEQWNTIIAAQLTELWTQFGNLTEIWFDGGYSAELQAQLSQMITQYQPHAVGFGGYGITNNCVRWDGTEMGNPPYPVWSTSDTYGSGDPNSTVWNPSAADFCLQINDQWFYESGLAVNSLADLISVYHNTVGANSLLELDFAIDETGQVDPVHAAAYQGFGDWIRGCYGTPVANTSGNGTSFTLNLEGSTAALDRIMIKEDQFYGQRIRQYAVQYLLAGQTSWTAWFSGSSVGNKRIQANQNLVLTDVESVQLIILDAIAEPVLLDFSVYSPCPWA
eukprot:m.464191 g.464191  ORF g.464191 m.464191 type:complete len:460 (+) comp57045_c1_seq14:106-1485(+)